MLTVYLQRTRLHWYVFERDIGRRYVRERTLRVDEPRVAIASYRPQLAEYIGPLRMYGVRDLYALVTAKSSQHR